MPRKLMFAALLSLLGISAAHAAEKMPIVLELFTSQGCSSCPPADALLKKLSAENSQLLTLSFHVDYWNYLGWQDPYSSPIYTARQRDYATRLCTQVYTPELVVNGSAGVIGSDDASVRGAVAVAQGKSTMAQLSITQANGHTVTITGTSPSTETDIWQVNYRPYARNIVDKGENGGRTLEHINSVTALKHLGTWSGNTSSYTLDMPANNGDKTAILVQLAHEGRIVGAYLMHE